MDVDLRISMERGWLEHAAMRQALRDIRRMCAPAVISAWEGSWDDRSTVLEARDLFNRVYAAADAIVRFVDSEDE